MPWRMVNNKRGGSATLLRYRKKSSREGRKRTLLREEGVLKRGEEGGREGEIGGRVALNYGLKRSKPFQCRARNEEEAENAACLPFRSPRKDTGNGVFVA